MKHCTQTGRPNVLQHSKKRKTRMHVGMCMYAITGVPAGGPQEKFPRNQAPVCVFWMIIILNFSQADIF